MANSSGPIRADGWLAYVATHDGEIHLVASDGSNDHALTTNTANINWHHLVWSPDHRWLAAVGNNKRGINQIYLLDTTSNLPDIDPIVNGFDPIWSPDSLQLAYLATEVSGATAGRSSVIDLKHRIVTHINDNLTSLSPQWFPDGQRLLVGQDTIYRVRLSNKSSGYQVNLVQHLNLDFINTCTATALSPEGSRLAALEQDKNGLPEVVIYNLAVEGAASTPIATIKKSDETLTIGRNCGQQRLTWTPTGHSIYFYAQGPNRYYTVLVSAISGETKFLGGVLEPSFNSNSNYLADYNPTTKQVYVISANSSRPTNPYPIANASFAPVWQPTI
jgi:Tol biopolymer transport system component